MAYDPNANAKLKNITSLAQYAANKINEGLSTIVGGGLLDTVPSTVDGGLWYEIENSAPAIKFYYGGHEWKLNSQIAQLQDPQLVITPATLSTADDSATAAVSYLGDGTVSVSMTSSVSNLDNYVTLSYGADSHVITANFKTGVTDGFYNTVTITAALSETNIYSADTATFIVKRSTTPEVVPPDVGIAD